jgi:hypothetical protein
MSPLFFFAPRSLQSIVSPSSDHIADRVKSRVSEGDGGIPNSASIC